jgi:hypothetical protein
MSSYVVCIRHPDYANEYRVFGDPVEIIDVDLGGLDLDDKDEFADWAGGLQERANALGRDDPNAVAAAMEIQQAIAVEQKYRGH